MSQARRRSALTAGLAAGCVLALSTNVAWAAPEGRIQQVESSPGVVEFLFSAEGLQQGETIDPESVQVSIAGEETSSTATNISDSNSDAAPTRTVMLTLDTSTSMGDFGKLTIAKSAATTFLDTVPDDVLVGLVSFSDAAELEVAPTVDRAAVRGALESLEPGGGTALNDAVISTVEELGEEGSRNAVLLSDGNDSESQATAKEARAVLAESGVILDAVSLGEGSQERTLARYARAGNGSVVTATNAQALTEAFESAARSVESQLAIRADVPADVPAGTAEVSVTALVADQPISDSTAAIIVPAAEQSTSATQEFGAIATPSTGSSILDQTWFLLVVIAVIFGSLVVILSLAVGVVDSNNRKQGRVSRRLQDIAVAGGTPPPAQVVESPTSLGESTTIRRAVSFADKVAAGRDTSAISTRLDRANVTLRPGEWVIVHGLIALLAVLLTMLLTNFNLLLTIIALVVGLLLPWWYLGYLASKRRKAFYAALPDSMQMLAGSLKAGYSLPQAFDNVAHETGGPMAQELNRALLESRLGLPLEETLEAAAQRMESRDFHWVVMAIRINRQVGGNLAEVLENVSVTIRERERLRRQVKALSAEGRLSAWILALLPIGIAVFLTLTRSEYFLPMFSSVLGWLMVAAGLILYVIGVVWLRNLVNMEV